MSIARTLILSGALVLGANAALAASSNAPRIQQGIYDAQQQSREAAPAVREGRASATNPAVEATHGSTNDRPQDPFYFRQAVPHDNH